MQDCNPEVTALASLRQKKRLDNLTRKCQRLREELIHTRRSALIFIVTAHICSESDDRQPPVDRPVTF